LTISANGSPACLARFSRIRSKTTIVSWTLKPMTVSIAGTHSAALSTWANVPRIAKIPTTTITSWTSATRAVTPNFTSWNLYVIQSRIPIDPTKISQSAWLLKSAETTGPIVVSEACSAIGPRAASRALTISPALPSVGSSVLPVGGVGDGAAELPGAADPLGAALGGALGVALGLGLGAALAEGAGEDD